MASRETSSINSQKVSRGFATALASAVLEWLLIFMIFIDGFMSYLITKFACYCDLQVPCLLCSRLDHVLGNEKLESYWDLICGNHKLEISSLGLCHLHNKLVEVHGMCESCLFSFATINKSNTETYRLLVGKMGEDHKSGSLSTMHCSCCNEPWISRGYAEKLIQTRSFGSEAAEQEVSLSDAGHDQNDLKIRRDRRTGSVRAAQLGNNVSDPLSHVGYMELKITSDTESEVLISDNEDASALVPKIDDSKEDLDVQCVHMEPHIITLADEFASEKLIDPASEPEHSPLLLKVHSDVDSLVGTPVASTVCIGHGLEELTWQQAENTADPAPVTELISFEDVPPLSNSVETIVHVQRQSSDVMETVGVEQTSLSESDDISKAGLGSEPTTTLEMGQEMKTDTGLQMQSLDLGDAYRIAVGNRGRQLSGKFLDQLNVKDSARVSEDLKQLLSQLSATRGSELSLYDMSPRLSGFIEDLKTPDASSSVGIQILQKRISLERNESGFESLDGSIISEVEGETVVGRLKRQIEHDRKLLSALYKELEEERNASAIAANQAMAMITRLQEEKASLHMEALQYLRMMEEQSEYDMDALQKSNDLLAEKEKEMQDLETELEFYRKKFSNGSMLNIVDPPSDLKARDASVERSEASCLENSASGARNLVPESKSKWKNSLFEFEDERFYISESLKKLEQRVHLFSSKSDLANGEYRGEEAHRISNPNELNHIGSSQKDNETEENDLSVHDDEVSVRGQENNEMDSVKEVSPMFSGETDVVSFGSVVSDLNYRLEALEADRDFLEHIINSLRNEDEALDFVQEIASHLRELRRIGIKRKELAIARDYMHIMKDDNNRRRNAPE